MEPLASLTILPSSPGGLGLLDHPERESELPLNPLSSLVDITVGMKGLKNQPKFELYFGGGKGQPVQFSPLA